MHGLQGRMRGAQRGGGSGGGGRVRGWERGRWVGGCGTVNIKEQARPLLVVPAGEHGNPSYKVLEVEVAAS